MTNCHFQELIPHTHTHTPKHKTYPHPYNLQLLGNIHTQHMFIIVIIIQQIFQMKLKTWEETLVLYFGVCVYMYMHIQIYGKSAKCH